VCDDRTSLLSRMLAPGRHRVIVLLLSACHVPAQCHIMTTHSRNVSRVGVTVILLQLSNCYFTCVLLLISLEVVVELASVSTKLCRILYPYCRCYTCSIMWRHIVASADLCASGRHSAGSVGVTYLGALLWRPAYLPFSHCAPPFIPGIFLPPPRIILNEIAYAVERRVL